MVNAGMGKATSALPMLVRMCSNMVSRTSPLQAQDRALLTLALDALQNEIAGHRADDFSTKQLAHIAVLRDLLLNSVTLVARINAKHSHQHARCESGCFACRAKE